MFEDGRGRRVIILAIAAVLLSVFVTDTEFYLKGAGLASFTTLRIYGHTLLFVVALCELFLHGQDTSGMLPAEVWDATLVTSIISVVWQVIYFRANTADGLMSALEGFLLSAAIVIFSRGPHKALFTHLVVGVFFRHRFYYDRHPEDNIFKRRQERDIFNEFNNQEVYYSTCLHLLSAALVIVLYVVTTPSSPPPGPLVTFKSTNTLSPVSTTTGVVYASSINSMLPEVSASYGTGTTTVPSIGDDSSALDASTVARKAESKKNHTNGRGRSVDPAPKAQKSNSFFANAPEKDS